MSRPLVPRPSLEESDFASPQPSQKPRKISTACGACKQRKTKCSGTSPCDACATRGSSCVYDIASDQRRKIANQQNLQNLLSAQSNLVEAQTNLERHQELLGGILATFRAGDISETDHLLLSIRSEVALSQLAAHVRNARLANPAIQEAFSSIQFVINGPEDLPSPMQLLNPMLAQGSMSRGSTSENSETIHPTGIPNDPYLETQDRR